MTLEQPWVRSRGLAPRFGRRLGVEVAPGLLIAMTVTRRAIAMATMRRLATTTPGSAIPINAALGPRLGGHPPIHLVICDPDHAHRTLLVPTMTARERDEVVRREIGREAAGDRVPVWHRVRQVQAEGVRKDELLIVATSEGRLQQQLDPVIAGGGVPRLVVTGPVALIAAARALAPTPLDRPTVLVHWGVSSLTIVILSEGTLKFARVIEPPVSDLNPLDWIPVEIDRSIRHYAVLSKGERVEQVMVSVAEGEPARRLFTDAALATRLRLPVTNLNALLAPLLPDRWDVDSELVDVEIAEGVFTLAYGAALLAPGDVPNLLPQRYIVQRRSRQVIGASVAANVLLLLALGSQSILLAGEAQTLRGRVAQAQSVRVQNQMRVEEAGRVEAERQRMRELMPFLTGDPLKLLPLDDALREIARLAPDRLRLEQLTLSTDPAGQAFRLAGSVQEPDFADAQKALNQFYYGLRASPLFYDVQLQVSVPSSAPTTDPATAPDGEADEPARALPFVLTLKPKVLQ